MMFGYATNETPELMPMPIALAHRLSRRLSVVRKDGTLPYLRPDGKTQVSVRYVGGVPVGVERVLISTQHAEGVTTEQIRAELGCDFYMARELLAEAGVEVVDRRGDLHHPLATPVGNTCPCGQLTGSKSRRYCSPECRERHGGKRQPDPTNHVTFTCETCGGETTKRKSIGNANRFCSNTCAHKHTKTVRNYISRDLDVVLESGWEVAFAGFCYLLKVQAERVDRDLIVYMSHNREYAPDFWLPSIETYVEVKGQVGADAEERWATWRAERGSQESIRPQDVTESLASVLADHKHVGDDHGSWVVTEVESVR